MTLDGSTLETTSPERAVSALRCPLGSESIRALLPHSWPFLFLDRVIELVPLEYGVGLKNVSVSEPYFAGHFPMDAIVPGVLIIESLAQLCGVVVASALIDLSQHSRAPTRSFLAGVNRMRFRVPVRPGDQLRLEVTTSSVRGAVREFRAAARLGSRVAAEGSLVLAT